MRPSILSAVVPLGLVACFGGGEEIVVDAPVAENPTVAPIAEDPGTPTEPALSLPADRAAMKAALQAKYPDAKWSVQTDELSGEIYGDMVYFEAATDVFGASCKGGVTLADSAWSCTLGAPLVRGGYKSEEGRAVAMHYGNGARAALVLDEVSPPVDSVTVDGVRCKAFLHLRANGHLETCTLAEDWRYGPGTLKAGSEASFDEEGRIASAVAYEPHTSGGKEIHAGMLEFAKDGSITSIGEGVFGD